MKVLRSLLLIASVLFAAVVWSRPLTLPENGVAYTIDGKLVIKDELGRTIGTIRTKVPIGAFAISHDRTNIAFAPSGPDGNGGPLYLLSLPSLRLKRILYHRDLYTKREVYSDPDFSPDGSHIVFAVRGQAHGDAVVASGPFAVLNLASGKARVLPATLKVGSGPEAGTAYGDNPRWSPDGRRIMLDLDTLSVIDLSGERLRVGRAAKLPAGYGIDWLGDNCIVYNDGYTDWIKAEPRPASVLVLSVHRTERLDELIGVPPAMVANLYAFSPTIMVRKIGKRLIVETQHGSWNIRDPEETGNVHVRILSRWTAMQVPASCR